MRHPNSTNRSSRYSPSTNVLSPVRWRERARESQSFCQVTASRVSDSVAITKLDDFVFNEQARGNRNPQPRNPPSTPSSQYAVAPPAVCNFCNRFCCLQLQKPVVDDRNPK